MESFRTKRYIVIGLLVLGLLGVSGCNTAAPAPPPQVQVVAAEHHDLDLHLELAGVFAPNDVVNVNAKIAGIVKEFPFRVGQTIRRGDTLLVLDTRDLEAQLNQAQAALNAVRDQAAIAKSNWDAALLSIETAKNGFEALQLALTDQVNQAQLNVSIAQDAVQTTQEQGQLQIAQAQLAVDNAQISYDNVKALYDLGEVSKLDLDRATKALEGTELQLNLAKTSLQAALQGAEAKLDAAQSAYNQVYGSGVNTQMVNAQSNISGAESRADTAQKQYEASSTSALQQAEANVNVLLTQLQNAIIVAPLSGTLVNTNIHEGELAQPGAVLATIVDTSILKLNVTVDQEIIPFLKVGQQVALTADIYPNHPLQASVTSIGPVSVSTGSIFPVEIALENLDLNLMAGLTVHASLQIHKDDVLQVPLSAIVQNEGQTYLYVLKGDTVQKRTVQLGLKNKEVVEIISGLENGEVVAISNVNTLLDGIQVEVRGQGH